MSEDRAEDQATEYLLAAEQQAYSSDTQRVFTPPDPGLAEAAELFETNHGQGRAITAILSHWKQSWGRTEARASVMAMAYFAARGFPIIVKKLLEGYMNHFGFPRASQIFAPLLHAYAVRQQLPQALDLFDRISCVFGLSPDLSCWNALLRAYFEVDDVDGASQCFAQIRDTGLALDGRTLEPMIRLCARRGDVAGSLQYFGLVEELKIRKTPPMYEALVRALVQQGDVDLAERAATQFVSENVTGSLTRMWNEVIAGYGQKRRMDSVMRIYHYLPTAGIARNDQTYTNVLMALVEMDQLRDAQWFFDVMMPRAGVQPDAYHIALLMKAYRRAKMPRRVLGLYNLMRRRGLDPTARTEIELLKSADRMDHRTVDQRGRLVGDHGLRPARHLVQHILERRDPRLRRPDDLLAWERRQTVRRAYPEAFEELLVNAYGRWRRHGRRRTDASEASLHRAYRSLSLLDGRGGGMRLSRLRLLAALIVGLRQRGDWSGVDRSWRAAVAEAATRARPMPPPPTPEHDGRVAAGRRYLLAPVLGPYLDALGDQGRIDDIRTTVQQLLEAGYDLDAGHWNLYVRLLAQHRQYLDAFGLCEQKLMPGWAGWAPLRKLHGLPTDAPPRWVVRYQMAPTVHTVRVLTRATHLIIAEHRGGTINPQVVGTITSECPLTLMAIQTMPHNAHLYYLKGSYGPVPDWALRGTQRAIDDDYLWSGRARRERLEHFRAMLAPPPDDLLEHPPPGPDAPSDASAYDGRLMHDDFDDESSGPPVRASEDES